MKFNINLQKINYTVITLELMYIFKEANFETITLSIDNPSLSILINKLKEEYPHNRIMIIFRLIQYIAKYGLNKCIRYINKINSLEKEVVNAYEAADSLLLLEWFKNYEPEDCFMFDTHPNLNLLWKRMDYIDPDTYGCHSGVSMGFTLRELKNICKSSRLYF